MAKAKLTRKLVAKVFEEFKDCHYISDALDNCNVNAVDFFMFLEDNEDLLIQFKKIEDYIALYLEDKVAKVSYNNPKPSHAVLAIMIQNKNKERYVDTKKEVKNQFEDMDDQDLDDKIKELTEQISKLS